MQDPVEMWGSVFQARLQDTKTLLVPNTDSVSAAASQLCGLNGNLRIKLSSGSPELLISPQTAF
jgi:hypothetical protein